MVPGASAALARRALRSLVSQRTTLWDRFKDTLDRKTQNAQRMWHPDETYFLSGLAVVREALGERQLRENIIRECWREKVHECVNNVCMACAHKQYHAQRARKMSYAGVDEP